MPVVPLFENQVRAPTIDTPRADPGAFAEPGAATAEAGAQFGETMQAWQAQYAEAKRQSNAAGLLDQGLTALGNAQFAFSKVPDHQQAYTEFQQFAAQTRQKLLAQTSDPLVQAYVGRAFDQQAIMMGMDTRNAAFRLESSTQVGALDQRLVNYQQRIALAGSPLERAHLTDLAHADIAGSVAGRWLAPEQGSLLTIKFNSDAAEAQAKQFAASDPVNAEKVLTSPQLTAQMFPGLLPEQAGNLAYQVEFRAGRREEQAIAAQQHADAVAERDFHLQQEDTETKVLASIYSGQLKDPSVITTLAINRQISPTGLEAAHTAMLQQGRGTDNGTAVLGLYRKLGAGQLTNQDVTQALANGQVATDTAVHLQQSLNALSTEGVKAATSEAMSRLRTAFSASAVERGIFGPPDRAPEAALWSDVQGEFFRRVSGGEKPGAVANDLIVREAPTLPQPSLGTVHTLTDVGAIWERTIAAHAAGHMSDTQFDDDALRLNDLAARLRMMPARPGSAGTPVTGAPARTAASGGGAQGAGIVDVPVTGGIP